MAAAAPIDVEIFLMSQIFCPEHQVHVSPNTSGGITSYNVATTNFPQKIQSLTWRDAFKPAKSQDAAILTIR